MKKRQENDKRYKLYQIALFTLLSFEGSLISIVIFKNDSWIITNLIYAIPCFAAEFFFILGRKKSIEALTVKYCMVYCLTCLLSGLLIFETCIQKIYTEFLMNPFSIHMVPYVMFCALYSILILAFCDWFFYLHFIASQIPIIKIARASKDKHTFLSIIFFGLIHIMLVFNRKNILTPLETIDSYYYISDIWIFIAAGLILPITVLIYKTLYKKILMWKTEFLELRNIEYEIFDSLFSAADIFCCEIDRSGNFTKVSKAIEKMLGYRKNNLIGKPIIDFLKNEEEYHQLKEMLCQYGEINDYELRITDKYGKLHYLNLQAKMVTKEQPDDHTIGIITDMTAYHEVSEKSEKYRKKYITLFEKMLSAYIVLEPVYREYTEEIIDVRLINANPFFFNMYFTKMKKKDLINHTWEEITGQRTPELERFRKIFLKGETVFYESFYPETDRYFQSNAFLLDKNLLGVVFYEITDAKKEEIMREKSEKKYRMLCEKTLNGIMIMEPIRDSAGEMTDVLVLDLNMTGARIMGYLRENVVGKTWNELFGYKNRILDQYERILNEDIFFQYNYYHPVLEKYFKTVTYRLDENQLAGIFEDATDQILAENEIVTLNKDLEQRVEQRTKELKNALKDLEAFSYTVSHDLKSPLRAISIYGQFLSEGYNDPEWKESKEMIDAIIGTSNQMIVMIDKLLQFSSASKHNIVKIKFNIAEMITKVCKEFMDANPFQKIILEMKKDKIPIFADEYLLRVVISNILSNAVKFSRGKEETIIKVKVHKKDTRTVLSFQDNGVGFEMQYVDKLYQVFQRLHTTDEFEGSGIGLATVKKIMERHDGETWITSEIGEGTTIYLRFPSLSE